MHMALYNGLLWVASPVLTRHMEKRLAIGKEDPARFEERFGVASRARPDGELVWIHAASVGEAVSALALVGGLLKRAPERQILVTTGTRTSAEIMAARLPERAFHQYIPIDRKVAVHRFLDHWRPELAIWMESEIWPNLIFETAARNIPMMLANARITKKSYDLWRKSLGFSKKLLGAFRYCSAQSEISAVRLRALGADPVECVGNLKFSSDPLPVDEGALRAMLARLKDRPLWLAASTHKGEEGYILAAHERLRADIPDILTVIVPRHPERGGEVAELAAAENIKTARRSAAEEITEETGIYVADTIGELGLFYRLAGIVYIGGSLIPNGGQNPLEAARLNCAVLYGPHMDNFADVMEEFQRLDAAREVHDAAELAEEVAGYLRCPATRDDMAARAAEVVKTGKLTLEKNLERIEDLLKAGRG
ncbi:MAG: 3-deoxy-D-manno-octulosonic acid transferase [Sneathiella sp.]|nr:3-deoxy-D-manno-octulosonic acid transferase [Sneathiella sp.]